MEVNTTVKKIIIKALQTIPFIYAVTLSTSVSALGTKMLQQPDILENKITFVYAGDIWIADRDGSDPSRLTSDQASEVRPQFSPDGQSIAFSANYHGNMDVYTISIKGGQPKRLTWHPDNDLVEDWSPDGQRVVFTSEREINHNRAGQMFEVSKNGGHPKKVMDARVVDPSWSSDGKKIAYRPFMKAHRGASGWRQHRGGSTPPIWIYNPKNHLTTIVPHNNSSDFQPMWVGEDVYFLSDRDGSVALYGFNKDKGVWLENHSKPWDILSANSSGKHIIYDAGGELILFNTENKTSKILSLMINPDLPQRRVSWKSVTDNIENISLSPTAKRLLITARGDVFTLPIKDGSVRNITQSDGVREMTGIWSADGSNLAYLSDSTGAYKLMITDQNGKENKKSYSLSKEKTNYFSLVSFADDDTKVLFRDSHLNLKYVDLKKSKVNTIATDLVRKGFIAASDQVAISSDSKWISYSLIGPSNNQQLYLYNFDSGKATVITDGMSDAGQPAFSIDGKYLYFTASTNRGTSAADIDMSQQERPYRTAIYAMVLQSDGKSPLLPKSDEENDDADDKEDEKENDDSEDDVDIELVIDLKGIQNRIVALPIAERNYANLSVAEDGSLFYLDSPQPGASTEVEGKTQANKRVIRFDMKKHKAKTVISSVVNFSLSKDGKTILYQLADDKIETGKTDKKIEGKSVSLSDLKMRIDPKKEWLQIFNDAWRMEKDYFYAENMHGLDWQGIYDQYRPLVDHVGRREDLTKLIVEMIAELQVGHNRSYKGDVYSAKAVKVGLLGADIDLHDGHYRLKKIYTGEKWNPFYKAPLAIPGIDINEGDYILAVNGKALSNDVNFFSAFENTVSKQVTLTVSSHSKGKKPREVIVVPTSNERKIRLWSWIEKNRKYVDEKSKGRVGYVYVPNTTDAGFTYFNRMFFSQLDKEGIIIDERSNGGGQVANYITDVLSRTYLAGYQDRDGKVYGSPVGALDGPKVMLIDQDAGSGGDFLPYAFRHEGIGKLIGTRTWGGLIGIAHNPVLVDGGVLTVPFIRIFDAAGRWLAENEGVAPDIEVKLMPADVNQGKDTQLDRGIEEVMKDLKTYKPIRHSIAPTIPTELGK